MKNDFFFVNFFKSKHRVMFFHSTFPLLLYARARLSSSLQSIWILARDKNLVFLFQPQSPNAKGGVCTSFALNIRVSYAIFIRLNHTTSKLPFRFCGYKRPKPIGIMKEIKIQNINVQKCRKKWLL